MQLGLPSTSTGVTTSSGLNQGYAQVLGGSNFDPVSFMSNYTAKLEKDLLTQQKEALQRKKDWQAVGDIDYSNINLFNQEQLEKEIADFEDVVAEASAEENIDPNSPSFQRQITPYKLRIQKLQNLGKEVENIVQQRLLEAKNFPPSTYQKWYDGLLKQPTVEDRYNYVSQNNPFKKPFDLNAALKKLLPAEKVEQFVKGNREITTTGLNRDEVKDNFEKGILLDPALKSATEEVYSEGFDAGAWKDSEEFVNSMVDLMMTFGKKEYKENKIGGSGRSGFGGSSTPVDVAVIPAGTKTAKTGTVLSAETVTGYIKNNQFDELANTDLISEKDKNTIFSIDYKNNTQAPNGNYVTARGESITGRPNAFKFSLDGSLWGVLGENFILIEPSDMLKGEHPNLVTTADANKASLASALGRTDLQDILSEVYANKTVGGTNTTTILTEGSLDNID